MTPYNKLEMCGNGFQHSHSLPFPSIQFPFPPTPIHKFLTYSHSHGIPVWAIPIPSHPHFLVFDLFPFPWDSRVGYSHSLPFPFCQC